MLLAASALFAQFKNQASWTRGNRNIKNPLPPKPIKVVPIGIELPKLDNLKVAFKVANPFDKEKTSKIVEKKSKTICLRKSVIRGDWVRFLSKG